MVHDFEPRPRGHGSTSSTPREHPNPHENRLKWVVNSPTPKWDSIGLTHGHVFVVQRSVSAIQSASASQVCKPSASAFASPWLGAAGGEYLFFLTQIRDWIRREMGALNGLMFGFLLTLLWFLWVFLSFSWFPCVCLCFLLTFLRRTPQKPRGRGGEGALA